VAVTVGWVVGVPDGEDVAEGDVVGGGGFSST
jgi:hypothetical protein